MRASPGADTLYIEGGTYASGTISLTSADNGDSFLAYQNQQAVISGGTTVGGWTVGSDGVWQAHVGLSNVQQFVVNGVAQTDARYPNTVPSNPVNGGWLWAQSLPSGGNTLLQMAYNKSDFPAGIQPTAGEKVTVFSASGYSSDVLTIQSVDTNAGVITFGQPATYDIGPGSRYYISGGQPLLDQAGEYYFDPSSQTLYYRPQAGFDGTGAVAAGGDQTLVNVTGASNITFKGLSFANATTTAQTDDVTTAAVVVNGSTGVTVDSSTFTNVAQGVLVEGTSSGNTVSNNAFSSIGTSAVTLNPQTANNTVINNSINQSNNEFATSGAIQMFNSANNTISNNLIQNVPRFGISEVNWDPTIAAGNNTIQNNVILNSGQATPDVGAIYIFSHSDPGAAGDVIRYNNVQNVGGPQTGANGFTGTSLSWGIYLDDYASNAQIYGNFVSGTANGGVILHGGNNNSVYDNVLVNGQNFGMELQAINGSMSGTQIYNNVIETSSQSNVGISMDPTTINPSFIHNNIYWTTTGATPNYNTTSFAQFQAEGGDSGSSVTTSVGFTNPSANDYSFASGSMALANGIPQLPWSQMGPTGTPGAGGATVVAGSTPTPVTTGTTTPVTTAPVTTTPVTTDPTSVTTTPVTITPGTGISVYDLPDGQLNSISLTNTNFSGVNGATITVNGGNDGNTVDASAVTGARHTIMVGGAGDDILIAARDATMTGGAGVNEFVLTKQATWRSDHNTITDFVHGTDKIVFSDLGFDLGVDDGLGTATLQSIDPSLLSTKTDGTFSAATDRFAYNTGTGQLLYGSSGQPTSVLATLTNKPNVIASDLFFIQ